MIAQVATAFQLTASCWQGRAIAASSRPCRSPTERGSAEIPRTGKLFLIEFRQISLQPVAICDLCHLYFLENDEQLSRLMAVVPVALQFYDDLPLPRDMLRA